MNPAVFKALCTTRQNKASFHDNATAAGFSHQHASDTILLQLYSTLIHNKLEQYPSTGFVFLSMACISTS